MTILTEGRHAAEFVLSEASGSRSRGKATIMAGAAVAAATVLGMINANAGAVTVGNPVFTGTGNGTLTKAAPAHGPGVQEGTYSIQLIEEVADAGRFQVLRPDGTIDGVALVGVAYVGQVRFTIADGATNFSGAAKFALDVTIAEDPAAESYGPLDPEATNGLQNAAAIAMYAVSVTDTDRAIAIIERDAEVNANILGWPEDIEEGEKAAAITQLAARGVIGR